MRLMMSIFVFAGLSACATVLAEDSAEYAANCMAAAASIQPVAESGEITDLGPVEIYQAVEAFWSEKVSERAADEAAAEAARAAAMGEPLTASDEAAVRDAQALLRACEATTGGEEV